MLGPRAAIRVSPDFLNSLIPVAKDKVSVMDLPGLMWNGLTESGKDLFDGVISLAEFTSQEALHLVKGEDLVTVQAAALLKEFIGEEAARYAMGENLKSAVMAKVLVRRFQKLSHEERIQGGVKLYLSIVVEPLAAFKGLLAARKAGKQITQATKEAAKSGIPQPVIFAPVSKTPALADLSKTGQNLEQLAPKLRDVPKVRVLKNAPEPVQFAPVSVVSKSYTPKASSMGQANIAQVQHLKRDLECRTCQSIFNSEGGLSYGAIQESEIIKVGTELHNKEVILALSQRGNLKDWGKYRTQLFSTHYPSPNIGKSTRNLQAEVHFYRNSVTNEVYYGKDYKVKFQLPGNPQMPTEKFISELPDSWRVKP